MEKPLLAIKIVDDIQQLLEFKELSHLKVERIEPHGAEQLAAWITRLAPILMAIAFIGIYLDRIASYNVCYTKLLRLFIPRLPLDFFGKLSNRPTKNERLT